MLSSSGAVKVVDFGIAKAISSTAISQGGTLKGKTAYMSPEQAHGRPLDGRSDLFAVGIVLHELLTGKRLFRGRSEAETLALMLNAPVGDPSKLLPDVPDDLGAIAMGLLRRDVEARTATSRLALEDLLGCSATSSRAALDLEALLKPESSGTAAPAQNDLHIATIGPQLAPATRNLRQPPVTVEDVASAYTLPDGGTTDSELETSSSQLTRPIAPSPPGAAAPLASTLTRSRARPLDLEFAEPSPSRSWIWMTGLALILAAASASLLAWRAARDNAASADAPDSTGSPTQVSKAVEPAQHATPTTPSAAPAAADRVKPVADAGIAVKKNEAKESRKPGKARVKLHASPWALIRVDGVEVGETPRTLRLATGERRIELYNPDLGKRHKVVLELKRGRRYTVSHDFE